MGAGFAALSAGETADVRVAAEEVPGVAGRTLLGTAARTGLAVGRTGRTGVLAEVAARTTRRTGKGRRTLLAQRRTRAARSWTGLVEACLATRAGRC